MNFLGINQKSYLISGVANKKSVAYHTATLLKEAGAKTFFTVQSKEIKEKVEKLFPEDEVFICNVEDETSIKKLASDIKSRDILLSGFLHSIAFANYSEGVKPFIETKVQDFLQATNISCLSLVTMAQALRESFYKDASIVTVSISSTKATSYGYMGPIKSALETSVAFLAKSFSEFSNIRVNAVCAGPLKTSASAGIPGYINNYLYAEQLTLRKQNLATVEVANTILFLLSDRSSGINASGITVDAGMNVNYFDQAVVNKATE